MCVYFVLLLRRERENGSDGKSILHAHTITRSPLVPAATLKKLKGGLKQVSGKHNPQRVLARPTLAKIAVIASAETSGDTLSTTRVEHGGDKESR